MFDHIGRQWVDSQAGCRDPLGHEYMSCFPFSFQVIPTLCRESGANAVVSNVTVPAYYHISQLADVGNSAKRIKIIYSLLLIQSWFFYGVKGRPAKMLFSNYQDVFLHLHM